MRSDNPKPILWRSPVPSWGGRLSSRSRNTSHSMEIDTSRWPCVMCCVYPWFLYCTKYTSDLVHIRVPCSLQYSTSRFKGILTWGWQRESGTERKYIRAPRPTRRGYCLAPHGGVWLRSWMSVCLQVEMSGTRHVGVYRHIKGPRRVPYCRKLWSLL